ncbi:MAG: gluconeogenesis factor YvcK family protein [Bacillota bacterium]
MRRRRPRQWKWFLPGMGVKRWFFLALIGAGFLVLGLTFVLNWDMLVWLANFFTRSRQLLGGKGVAVVGVGLLVTGAVLLVYGLLSAITSVVMAVLPYRSWRLVDKVWEKRNLRLGPNIVVIGGGTGLSVLLRGLKEYTSNLTAVVTMADDGGSSGRLREHYGMLPPGDVRNCLAALAEPGSRLGELLQYRFNEEAGLKGHTMGNLMLTAMTQLSGSFVRAINELGLLLAVRGRVLPSTTQQVTLVAEMSDGRIVRGESLIPGAKGRIRRVWLEPEEVEAYREVIKAIQEADIIVLGPGSLYTSVLPNLLIKPIAEALAQARCPKVYVCNIMTQPGETDDYTVSDHVAAIQKHAGDIVDVVIANKTRIPADLLRKYAAQGQYPVRYDGDRVKKLNVVALVEPVADLSEVVRHNAGRLARIILRLTKQWTYPY